MDLKLAVLLGGAPLSAFSYQQRALNDLDYAPIAFKVPASAARQFIGPLIERRDSLDKGHTVSPTA